MIQFKSLNLCHIEKMATNVIRWIGRFYYYYFFGGGGVNLNKYRDHTWAVPYILIFNLRYFLKIWKLRGSIIFLCNKWTIPQNCNIPWISGMFISGTYQETHR